MAATATRQASASVARETEPDVGVLFVPGVPRATLRELSGLARQSGMSRAALVRRLVSGYVAAVHDKGVAV